MNTIKKVKNKLLYETHAKILRRKLHTKEFTLITQNCIGGVLYHMFGLPFQSPTINMFIEDENFVKLAETPEHYLKSKPVPVSDCYVDPIDNNIQYPVIGIDDIRLCCLHYKNCDEAIEQWKRRCERVQFDKLFIVANTWNLHDNEDLIKRIDDLKDPHIIFDDKGHKGDSIVRLQGDFWYRDERGIIRPNITDISKDGYHRLFEETFDFVNWINENIEI